jgi:hypothetical protein
MTRHHIENEVKSFLDKCLSKVGDNIIYSTLVIVRLLIESAKLNDSIKEVAYKPDSDSVFKRLEHATLELIKKAFEQHIRTLFKNTGDFFKRGNVILAFDETYEEYFGKVKNAWIWGYKPVKGAKGCFKFLVLSIVKNNRRYVLGAVPVHIGYNREKTIAEMIRFAGQFVKIRAILFDKGFYDAGVVQQLDNKRIGYVILAPKNKKTRKYLEQKGNTFEHVMETRDKYNKYELKLKIKVARNVYEYDWLILTNLDYRNTKQLVDLYRKRWNIENIFKITDRIRLRTNSTNIVVKTLFFIIALLLYNLWQWFRLEIQATTLRRFVKIVLMLIEEKIASNKPPPEDMILRADVLLRAS